MICHGFSPNPHPAHRTEPFMYPEILKIIEMIWRKNFPFILRPMDAFDSLCPHIVELCQSPSGVDMAVSVDDIGEAHDRIRGVPGTFDRAIEGIRAVVNAGKKKSSFSLNQYYLRYIIL